jgi:hypothetical protein
MALYTSEFTQFLQQLRTERPHLEADQRKGRAIWWDKGPIDLDRTRRNLQSRIAQQPYPYQSMDETELERSLAARDESLGG